MKKTKTIAKITEDQSGNAMIETLPLVVIFVILLGYGIGFFAVVHTAILNSIAARAYAFETFSYRSDTTFFRDRVTPESQNFLRKGNRLHVINSERMVGSNRSDGQFATARDIVFGRRAPTSVGNELVHNTNIYNIPFRNRKGNVEVSPAWIMIGYGLCINARCGDQ